MNEGSRLKRLPWPYSGQMVPSNATQLVVCHRVEKSTAVEVVRGIILRIGQAGMPFSSRSKSRMTQPSARVVRRSTWRHRDSRHTRLRRQQPRTGDGSGAAGRFSKQRGLSWSTTRQSPRRPLLCSQNCTLTIHKCDTGQRACTKSRSSADAQCRRHIACSSRRPGRALRCTIGLARCSRDRRSDPV